MQTNSDHLANAASSGATQRDDSGPRFKHDCASCVYLGRHGDHDLYFHEGNTPVFTTVIARFGGRGEYTSGLCFAFPYKSIDGVDRPANPHLHEAVLRAIPLGYGEAIAKATA